MYKVIKRFFDLQDNNHSYSTGDTFPRNGMEVDIKRIKELKSHKNKMGVPLIEEIIEKSKKTNSKAKKAEVEQE